MGNRPVRALLTSYLVLAGTKLLELSAFNINRWNGRRTDGRT